MTTLSYAQLEGVWIAAGGNASMAPLMAAIAEAESSGDPTSQNDQDNNGTQSSYGLWQISTGTHTPPSPNWADPVTNAKLAIQKLNTQGLSAWGTYTSGAYKAFLSNGTTPSSDFQSSSATTGTSATAASTTSNSATCLIGFNASALGASTSSCLFSKTQARALIGGLLLTASAFTFLVGTAVLVAFAFKKSGAASAVAQSLPVVNSTTKFLGKSVTGGKSE